MGDNHLVKGGVAIRGRSSKLICIIWQIHGPLSDFNTFEWGKMENWINLLLVQLYNIILVATASFTQWED